MNALEGRTAIVTGAARGIGLGIATAFVAAGARVLMTDILAEEAAQAAANLGANATSLRHDSTDEGDWAAAVAKAERLFGGIDIVVNNAGIETAALMSEIDPADYRRVFDVNVLGVILGTKYAFRAMRPNGSTGRGGAIINIASGAAVMHATALSLYGASKAAVAHFTRTAAVEAGALGYAIRSNCIMPGMVETSMARQLGDHFAALGLIADEATMRASLLQTIPLKRYAQTSEIGAVATFLASAGAAFMTGACIPVDGGNSLV